MEGCASHSQIDKPNPTQRTGCVGRWRIGNRSGREAFAKTGNLAGIIHQNDPAIARNIRAVIRPSENFQTTGYRYRLGDGSRNGAGGERAISRCRLTQPAGAAFVVNRKMIASQQREPGANQPRIREVLLHQLWNIQIVFNAQHGGLASAKYSSSVRSQARSCRLPIASSTAKQKASTGAGAIRQRRREASQSVSEMSTAQLTSGTVTYRSAFAAVNVSSATSIRPAAVMSAVSSVKQYVPNRTTDCRVGSSRSRAA